MTSARQRIAGIACLGLLALVVVMSIARPSNPLAEEHTYYADFDSAHGLAKVDRDVRIAGVKVGEIGEVTRKGDDVRVELNLSSDFPVYEDATAAMRPHTLFEGSTFIDLSPGSPSAKPAEEGSAISIKRTRNYVTLDEALRVLRPEIRNRVRDVAASSAKAFRGRAVVGIERTLREAPDLMKSLAPAARAVQGPDRTELAGTIRGLARTSQAVASREADLAQSVRGMGDTGAALTVDDGAALDAALAELPAAVRELEVAAPKLESLASRLRGFALAAEPGLPELASALPPATATIERAVPVLRDGEGLVRDARLIAARLGEGSGPLTEMLEMLPRPLDQLDETLVTLNQPSAHGTDVSEQLVGGAFAAFAGVDRGFQTQANNPARPGQVQRSSVYISPQAATTIGDELGDLVGADEALEPPRCAMVEIVSPSSARELRAIGGCE